MKKIVSITSLVTLGIFFLVISCSKTPKTVKPPVVASTGEDSIFLVDKPTIITNVDDPMFLSYKLSDGRLVEYFGTRDASGLPKKINEVLVAESETSFLRYIFDDSMRLSRMVASNGEEVNLNWLTNDIAMVTAVSGDHKFRTNTMINFSDPDGLAWSAKQPQTTRVPSELKIEYTPITASGVAAHKTTAANTVQISVTSCLAPVDIEPVVVVRKTDGTWVATIAATNKAQGQYEAIIPDLSAKISTTEAQYCDRIIDLLDGFCPVLTKLNLNINVLCSGLGVVTTVIVRYPPAGAWTTVACRNFMLGLKSLCKYKVLTLADKLDACEAIFNSGYSGSNIVMYPLIGAAGGPVYGTTNLEPVSGPFRPMSIEVSGSSVSKPDIRSVILHPPDPLAQNSYTAETNIYCMPAGTKVTVSVFGTDGYRNSVTYTAIPGSGKYTLPVPGAVRDVFDIVTVEAITPNGTVVQGYASLTFR